MAKKPMDERAARLTSLCDTINKGTFGGEQHDAVTFLGSTDIVAMERWTSGCIELDYALGGGWPKGRFIELFGSESGGKTTLALQAIAEHQKKYVDEDVGFIDSEYALDEIYAKALGVDMRYMLVNQPDSGEQALNVLSQMVMGGVKLIVVDSVAALTTKAELEGDIGDIHVGQQARLMSTALRRLVQETGSRNSTVIWTNQMRDKIGVTYGDRTTTPAGHALKHYASIRVHVARIATVKEDIDGKKVAVCNKTKADVKKNKCSPPFRVAEFYITYGYGVDRVAGILDAALELGVAEKRGAWFSFDGEQLGQGRLSTLDRMRGDEELSKKIMDAVQVARDSGVKATPAEKVSSFKKPKSMGKKNSDPDAIDSEETSVEDA